LLYQLLKIPARLGFWLYCRRLKTNNDAQFKLHGPLLIAANHPNSFLDAIIIATLFKQPVYSLARGDAFKNPLFARILRSLNMYPVYRTSEGVENMEHNYSTFDACKEIFKKKGIVLIFSEGRCINEWHLRPLKKGTARLALSSWQEGIDLKVLPTGINYHRFHSYDKDIHLLFGNIIDKRSVDPDNGFGRSVLSFNKQLENELRPLVYEIEKTDIQKQRKLFFVPVAFWKKIVLLLPALIALLTHFPLYFVAKAMADKYGRGNDHYDSIFIAVLFMCYPIYLLLISMLTFFITGSAWAWLLLILMPFCSWSYLQLKNPYSPKK
jgi:1-acyl-sn-glycerol-3-phosphate acyltransferase